MKSLARVVTAVAVVLGVAGISGGQAGDLTPDQLQQWLQEGRDFLLIDARPKQEYDLKRIGNALNIPGFVIGSRKLPRDRVAVLYDDGVGTRNAQRAAEELTEAGHRDVWILRGGLAAWEAQGYPIAAPRGVMPIPLVQPISAPQLAQALADGVSLVLVDIRTLEEFAATRLAGAVHGPAIELDRVLAGVPREQILIVYDNGDGEGERQAERLRRGGFRVVRYLYGGLPAWVEKRLPLEQ